MKHIGELVLNFRESLFMFGDKHYFSKVGRLKRNGGPLEWNLFSLKLCNDVVKTLPLIDCFYYIFLACLLTFYYSCPCFYNRNTCELFTSNEVQHNDVITYFCYDVGFGFGNLG